MSMSLLAMSRMVLGTNQASDSGIKGTLDIQVAFAH
jgi:hypothetical protein